MARDLPESGSEAKVALDLTTCFWGVITTIYDAGMTLHSHRSAGYGERSVEGAEESV